MNAGLVNSYSVSLKRNLNGETPERLDNPVRSRGIMQEVWKDIDGYKGLYQVSNKGNVRNSKGHLMHLEENTSKYLRVKLGCPQKKFFVHRLVAKAFCEGYFEGAVVNHKDCNKHNNACTNLEWVTPSQNQKHAYLSGRISGAFKPLVRSYIYKGVLYKDVLIRDLIKTLGFCKNTLYNYIEKGKILCVSNDYPEKE